MKKKLRLYVSLPILCALLLSLCLPFSACGRKGEEGLSVVTTIFPLYDWAREVTAGAGDVSVRMLCDSGTDLHNFQPSAEDIIAIGSADVFLYVGGESDEWVERALAQNKRSHTVALNLLDLLGNLKKEEEEIEGVTETEHHEGGIEYDEHIWLSLRCASFAVDQLADTLSSVDPDRGDLYRSNADAYTQKLDDLDRRYAETLSGKPLDTLLFADRFPFRYLADDYGLTYFAAFSGCSAESEVSFETVTFLSGKIDELGLGTVLVLEGSDHRIADTVIASTKSKNARILTVDSLQSVTRRRVEEGVTYLSAMENNLTVFSQALSID